MRNSKWKLSSSAIFTLFIFHLNCGDFASPDPKARKREITQKITPLLLGIRNPIDSNQSPTNSSSYDPNAKYLPSETEIQTSIEFEKSLEDQDLLKPEALQKTSSDFSALNKYVVLSPTEIDTEAEAWKNGTPLPEKTLTTEELKARS